MRHQCHTCGGEDCGQHSDFRIGQQVRVQEKTRVEVGTIVRVNPTSFTLRTQKGDIRVKFPWLALRHGIHLDVQVLGGPGCGCAREDLGGLGGPLLDKAVDLFRRPLGDSQKQRIALVLHRPTAANWRNARSIVISPDRPRTLWQAVVALDPRFTDASMTPDALTIARALRSYAGERGGIHGLGRYAAPRLGAFDPASVKELYEAAKAGDQASLEVWLDAVQEAEGISLDRALIRFMVDKMGLRKRVAQIDKKMVAEIRERKGYDARRRADPYGLDANTPERGEAEWMVGALMLTLHWVQATRLPGVRGIYVMYRSKPYGLGENSFWLTGAASKRMWLPRRVGASIDIGVRGAMSIMYRAHNWDSDEQIRHWNVEGRWENEPDLIPRTDANRDTLTVFVALRQRSFKQESAPGTQAWREVQQGEYERGEMPAWQREAYERRMRREAKRPKVQEGGGRGVLDLALPPGFDPKNIPEDRLHRGEWKFIHIPGLALPLGDSSGRPAAHGIYRVEYR